MTFKSLLTNTLFKTGLLVSTTFLFIVIFYFSLRESNLRTTDVIPSFDEVTDQVKDNLGPFSTEVHAGLFIKNFTKFDVLENNFVMDGVVTFEFDPGETSLEMIEKFSFLNGEIIRREVPDVKLINGKAFARYEVKVKFSSDLRFHNYPYDYHRFTMILTNVYVSITSMILKTKDSAFNVDYRLSGSNWKITGNSSNYGYRGIKFDLDDEQKRTKYPLALFTVNFQGIGVKNALIIFIPMLFALLLGLCSLCIPIIPVENEISDPTKIAISLATAAVTSLLAYRFVIQKIIPDVGYLTTTDKVYIYSITIVFLVFLLQIVAGFISIRKKSDLNIEQVEQVNFLYSLLLLMTSIVSVLFLVNTLLLKF